MAGTRITATVDDAQARAMLARLGEPGTADLMPRLGEYLQRSTQERFRAQTAPDGTPWAPLQPRYARRKKYHQDKVLTLRGYLRGGIHYQVTGPHTVDVGSSTKYAAIHQLGGTIGHNAQSRRVRFRSVAGRVLFAGAKHKRAVTERWVTRGAYQVDIPARPFLGISAADDAEIREIILDWVVGRGK
ncbi:phage virion morphogenesis (putative tail completion) protein [Oryzisolibacter propanilivorax]|uniref:Phage virion morphogenesis (Putative tail completion) protein n=1 Tax=Oryzisolibacter propanilivorax TaxID=1527607 RepID=A0A1G9UBB6_9BURK|nr:phage virion morphogenesis protein [Oryzisolibacter propanilivorax]SDM57142.1 phage virion morphogenesis (putative tail completion) protein [Oryzisolibacter propanilivorax]